MLTMTTAAMCERRLLKDRFFQFSWRPRNASLLTAEQERDILKNLKKYSEKFAKDDDIILQQVRNYGASPDAGLLTNWLRKRTHVLLRCFCP